MLPKVFNAKVLLVIFHILVVGFVKPFFYVILCYLFIFCLFFVYFLFIFCLFFVFFPCALICFVSLDIIWLFRYRGQETCTLIAVSVYQFKLSSTNYRIVNDLHKLMRTIGYWLSNVLLWTKFCHRGVNASTIWCAA